MIKIKKIEFNNHKIFGNKVFDFTINDNIANTIVIIGNNGCGKTNLLKEINKLVIYDELFDKEGNSKFVELFSADNIFIDFIYMSNYIKVVIDNFNYSYLENIDYKDFNDDSNLHKNVEAIFTKEYLASLNELKIRLRLKLIVKEIIKTSDLEINNV